MTVEKERILNIIFDVIDELNRQRPKAQQIEKFEQTVLIGESGKLDSLGLINLIVICEQKVEEEFGVKITLASESAMSSPESFFKTVETLSNYIASLMEVMN